MKIGIACGGTGGHIFPGLAVAEILRQRGHTVILWLAGKPGEDLALAGWVGTVVTVYARGVSSHAPQVLFAAGLRLVRAVLQCRQSMRHFSPDVLLAMGSYASIGPVLAARWLNIPVVLHEANVIPGRAIRFLSRWAQAVALGFEETRQHLAHRRLVFVGMPVRQHVERGNQAMAAACRTANAGPQSEIENHKLEINQWGALIPGRFTLLIMGGSRGAHRLNEIVSRTVIRLHGAGDAIQVIHLTGQSDEEAVRQAYQKNGVPHAVFGFLHDMARAYRPATLAICRSGASTCAELAYYGVPALLVPYPFAIHQHQTANADALASSGSADICDEQILTVEWLASYVAGLMRDPARLAHMRAAALRRVTRDPAAMLADLVEAIGRAAAGLSKPPTSCGA